MYNLYKHYYIYIGAEALTGMHLGLLFNGNETKYHLMLYRFHFILFTKKKSSSPAQTQKCGVNILGKHPYIVEQKHLFSGAESV